MQSDVTWIDILGSAMREVLRWPHYIDGCRSHPGDSLIHLLSSGGELARLTSCEHTFTGRISLYFPDINLCHVRRLENTIKDDLRGIKIKLGGRIRCSLPIPLAVGSKPAACERESR